MGINEMLQNPAHELSPWNWHPWLIAWTAKKEAEQFLLTAERRRSSAAKTSLSLPGL